MSRLNHCKLVLFAAALAAIATQRAIGQSVASAPIATTAPDSKIDESSLPAFEVAVIRPSKSGGSQSHSGFSNGRFTAENIQLKTLLQYNAYGIPEPQILGGPPWLSSERFDIDAKVDDAVAAQLEKLSYDQSNLIRQKMVRQLLADRFKLAVHTETKEFPVYALMVAKGGPKLTASKDSGKGTGTSSNNGRLTATDMTMTKLAQALTQILSREVGRIVIDNTGLQGKYDLALTWSPDNHSANFTNASADNTAPLGPSIFTAVKEQLGLKLESTKAPVEVLVIDHIEPPTEN
jgi:uncharacterized protein (TIGR03435 family)